MTVSPRLFALLSLAAVPLAAADNTIFSVHREVSPGGPAAVIIELEPSSFATKSEGLTRLRRDLAAIERGGSHVRAAAAEAPLTRQFSTVLLGAAATVAPGDVDAIRKLPYVRRVVPDQVMHAYSAPQVLATVDAAQRVDAANLPTRGRGITVAVIDTGIDYTHPALGGGFGPGMKVAGGWDFVNDDADPMDDMGHGTHVAGIIAADSDTIRGVAPEATLLAYKVLDATGAGSESTIIAGIERAVDPNGDGDTSDHADVINLSLGGPGDADDPLSEAVNNAVARGVVVCAAAGNDAVTVSIGSPGAARDAITVGAVDDNNLISGFTSRGPARNGRDYSFKPDVTAPGSQIESTRMGGGTVKMTGTSMATPHVAGAAALLRALHRDWTPAQIKSALAMNATPVSGNVWARGAGKIDAARAANAALLADLSGISFGLDAPSKGTFNLTRTFTVTNISGAPQNVHVTAGAATPAALAATVSPASLALDPGGSATVSVTVRADNAALSYPQDLSGYGDLTLATAASTWRLPWALLRAARATVTTDEPVTEVTAFPHGGILNGPPAAMAIVMLSDTSAEFLADPHFQYDLFAWTLEQGSGTAERPEIMRILIKEDQALSGDDAIRLPQASAGNELRLASVDDAGTLLADLPVARSISAHAVVTHVTFKKQSTSASALFSIPGTRRIFVPTTSAAYNFNFTELYYDSVTRRAFAANYGRFQSVSGGQTLATGASQYTHATIRFRPTGANFGVGVCHSLANTPDHGTEVFIGCETFAYESGPVAYELFVTPDSSSEGHSGIVFNPTWGITPTFRVDGNGIVASDDRIPAPNAHHIANHGELTLGGGPYFPYFPGVNQLSLPPATIGSFQGAVNERYNVGAGADWALYDAHDALLSAGRWHQYVGEAVPAGAPGQRFEMRNDGLSVNGYPARSQLVINYGGNGGDLFAPTFSSLKIVDDGGHPSDLFRHGDHAALLFSALDWSKGATIANQTSATRVAYRVSGTSEWHDVPVMLTGTEYGIRTDLGHTGAGEIYRADLSGATAADNVRVDLRVEIEDMGGNHVTWTQEPALTIGAPVAPPHRRAAR